jgi:hypothetical protein
MANFKLNIKDCSLLTKAKSRFTKRQLQIAVGAVVIFLLGYFVGGSWSLSKGNGKDFYVEKRKGTYIYHSTMKCSNIQGGVRKNVYGLGYYYKNYVCPKCMNSRLSDICEKKIDAAFNAE